MTPIKKILLISVCAIAISGCHNSAEKTQAYLTKGINYYKQGDNVKARVELKNVIQIDNKQSDAFYYLALVDEKDQNWGGVFSNLKQAIALKPKNNDARIKLAKLYFSDISDKNIDKLSEKVTEQLEVILNVSPNDPTALTLKAGMLFKQHKVDEATAAVDAILKTQPDFPDALNLKANIYVVKNDFPSALAIANKAILAKPDELSFYILKLQIHDKALDKAAIEQDYLDIIKQFPTKIEFNYMLAQFYSRINQEDKAVKVLQETINKNPTEIMPKLTFIDYLLSKNRNQVEATIKNYLTQHQNDPELLFRLTNFYLQENKPAEAKQQLNLIISAKKDSKEALDAQLLLAELALPEDKSPKHEAVSAMIKDILAVNPLHLKTLILKAKITLSNGLYDEGINELRTILTNYPKADQAMVLLGQTYLMKKSPELAEENFYKALEVNPSNLDALKPILSKLMQNKDYMRAAELVQKGLAAKPNNFQLLKTLAQIKLSAADWAEVKKITDVFATQPKEVAFYNYLSGRVLQNEQKYADAIAKYQEVLTANPEFLEAMDGIIQSNEKLNKRSATFTYLDSYIKAHPDKEFIYLIKAELLMADKQQDQAVKTLTEAMAKWPKNLQFYMTLAKFYAQSNNTEQVIAVYNKALTNIPDSVDAKMALAGVYEQKQDYANALKLYEALLTQHPELEVVSNNIASLLLDHDATKENIARAVKLTEQFVKSENPYYLDTYAMALMANGRNDDAVQALQTVIAKNSDVPVFRYHLGVAYHKTNHDTAAVGELEQALALGEKAGGFAEKQLAQDLLKQIKK
jgi:tetratricopeptide (TPR) repeat protein